MEKEDRLKRLKDIEWTVGVIQQWAVNPSEYTEGHKKSILITVNVALSKLKSLIEDESKGELEN